MAKVKTQGPPPPPPPGFPPTNFKKWKTHDIQSYLLLSFAGAEYASVRSQIPLIHIKARLIKMAVQCEQTLGTPASPPAEHPNSGKIRNVKRGAKKKFVQRSKASHDAMRAAQRDMYHRNAKNGGGNSGFMVAHPTVQQIGFATVQSHKSLMVGSEAAHQRRQSNESLHRSVYGDEGREQVDPLAEQVGGQSSDTTFHPPNILVARAFRNWHSPRDHKEYERRKKFAGHHRNMSIQHTNPMSKSMRENFDFDQHPELDWPKYKCCEVSLGRHCPDICAMSCCRICCDPCGETGEHGGSDWAGHFGVGHDLYFKYLKLVGSIFTIMSLIMLPAMVINSFGDMKTDTEGLELYRMSLGNLGDGSTHNGTIQLPCSVLPGGGELYWSECFMDRKLYAWYYGLSDFFASCFFMLGVAWLWHYEPKEILHFQQLANFASVADYSVFVKNVPADFKIESFDNNIISQQSKKIEAHVKAFFETQIKEHVKDAFADEVAESGIGKTLQDNMVVDSTGEIIADVVLCLDEGNDIQFYQSRKPLKKALNRADWHIKKMKWELREEKKKQPDHNGENGMDERVVARLQKKLAAEQKSRSKIVAKMQKVMDKRKKASEKAKKNKKVVGAFVTFTTDMGHHLCIERYPKSYCSWCCQSYEKRWHGKLDSESEWLNYNEKLMTRVRLKKAPEPTTLMWENFEVGWYSRCCRKGVASIIALCMLVGSAFAVYYAKTVDATVADNVCAGTKNPTPILFANISCVDYVANTSLIDTDTRCLPILDLYPTVAIFKSKYAAGEVTGLGSSCYCRKYVADATVGPEVYEECTSYILYSAQKLGAVLLSSFMILLINGVYNKVVGCMAKCERHHAIDSMQASISYRAMLGQFCNTGLVYLLVNANLQGNAFFDNFNAAENAAGQLLSNLSGYSDFTPKWYAEVGNAMTLTMLMLAFSPHIWPLIAYTKFHLRIHCACCTNKAATQAELNQMFNPPQFHYMTRYAQLSVSILICMMFSTGIPFLYVVAAITCFTFYWVDKAMFCWLYAKPPQYDPKINQKYSMVLGYALVIHVAFGTWMLGNHSILRSNVGNNTQSIVSTLDDGTFALRSDIAETALAAVNADGLSSHLLQAHVLPLFSLMIFLIAGTILAQVWHLVEGIVKRLFYVLTCGRCCTAKTVFLKADFIDVKEDIALWGITSYNIFENPIYQMLFATDDNFAKNHRHLEDLGDINAIAAKEVQMSILRRPSDAGQKTIMA